MSTTERDSGAGAYSNLPWDAMACISPPSRSRGRSRRPVAELLALQQQVVEQAGGAEAEPVGVEPVLAGDLVDDHQVA